MNTTEFLSHLRSMDIKLWTEGQQLRISAPKGVLTTELREQLHQRKPEILAFLGHCVSAGSPPIRPVPRDGDLELSFSQQRLWFLNQLEPDSIAYNIFGGVQFKGRLRIDILNLSLSEIIRRHETLRTTYHEKDGKPIQVISPPSGLDLPVVDLYQHSGADRQAKIDQIIKKLAQDPFDLSKAPLLRSVLLRIDQEEHILLLAMHHIITDGWSTSIFARELQILYEAYSRGQSSPLPELAIQYADFAHWQREWLQGEVLDAQLAYWKKQLSPEPPALQLPADRPRPAVQTHKGAFLSFRLSISLLEKLKEISQRRGVTLFMVLLAAFEALVFRYTAQTDLAVGSPIAGRTSSEIEGLIGFFVNTLVLRVDLSGDPDFIELIDRVRKVCIDAYSNGELPFEKLVEELRPTRDMSTSPLFQIMFAFQNVPRVTVELPELTLSPLSIDYGTSMFDLTLFMWEDEEGLAGKIEYSTDLFNADTISRFIGHFETLLESAVVDPFRRLSELSFLTDSERHQLLVKWNDTYADYPGKCVNELFEEQAARTPDSTAVICAGKSLSYSELNRRANLVANHLLEHGAQPDDIIGIYTDRSMDMVVCLLGILKAGSAYTPLDPGFPEDRIEFMLQDSSSRILITQDHLKGNIGFSGTKICIDSEWEKISPGKDSNPAPLSKPANLAYVIYTSGSTGKPKGVQIPHQALVNFLYSMQKKPGLTSEDTVLSVTTMSFDIFGLELFLPLLFGGRVVIAEREDTLDGLRLAELIKEYDVSIMQATPSTWRLLIESGWSGHESLKTICGGEAFPSDLVGPMLSRCHELWNLYGPTETTIWSTAFRVISEKEPVLIGYPIDNTQVYILDNSLQPLPVGIVGELHIGGDGLSRGYLNRPELTEEKFIPHPLSDKPGARIYKTGDLARYRPDGSIECLGRIDHQVKLRGFRIELGEIEARIKDIEAVSNCVVTLREDRPGDKRLVAHYVVKDGGDLSVPDLRGYLQSKLPEYMVPQHFTKLDVIPLTPNGKVDRKALPEPVVEELVQEKFVAPRTELESAIASVWQQVLKVDKVGVNSNFFELGGYSLLMVQVLNGIRKLSNKDIRIMALFQHPTIASLANYLAGHQLGQPSLQLQQAYDRTQRQEKAVMRQEQLRKAREKVNG